MGQPSLRDRKRRRTRQAIVDAAVELFQRYGYEGTTVADIAAAAEIGTRTFFSYFPSKEDVLFPESDSRVVAALKAIETRMPDEQPVDILLRALREVDTNAEMAGPMAALRLRLARHVSAARGKALQVQFDAQREIAQHLQAAFPGQLDAVHAAALVGAFIGAVTGALQVLFDEPGALDDPRHIQRRMREATSAALRPWLVASGSAAGPDARTPAS